jgi:hypothetical protein
LTSRFGIEEAADPAERRALGRFSCGIEHDLE